MLDSTTFLDKVTTEATQKSNPFNPFLPTKQDLARTEKLAESKLSVVICLH
ncbi:MAG: hypothetical protein AAGE84_27070 [Cyanobacteria bacterium P01_G01_bin.39]